MSDLPVSVVQPVILCGGHGARLWPLSTERRPKPFLPLMTQRSMLAETAARVCGETTGLRFLPVMAVGSVRHEALLKTELSGAALVLEPVARNSAAAVAAACLAASEGLVLLLPADHHIADVDAFRQAVSDGAAAASTGRIITFGVRPYRAATGYGYIEVKDVLAPGAVAPVARFVEKPDLATAQSFLAGGRHLWNAGIFLVRSDILLGELNHHAPDILAAVRKAYGEETGPLAQGEVRRLHPVAFSKAPSDSIDYAVMEKSDRVSVVQTDMGWADIGDYGALHALKQTLGSGAHEGAVFTQNAENCFIRSDGPLVAVRNVRDLAIVATPRGVLVTPLEDASSTKSLAEDAAMRGFAAAISPERGEQVRRWMFDSALPLWADSAWDSRCGGFFEAISMDGRPLPDLARRGRVAPRQVFAFSKAKLLGWNDPRASTLIADGLDWLDTRARAPSGFWAGLMSADGEVLDPTATLYDHAFVVLAGAWAYRATGETRARDIAEEALEIVVRTMSDRVHGGFFDDERREGLRRSNPHMHLLEASLALYQATGESEALELGLSIVELFEERFFETRTGALTEHFERDWSRAQGDAGLLSEPGHCYEWAVLLGFFEEACDRDLISWRRRLIGFADRTGRNAEGFACDAVTTQGEVLKSSRRLWPQLEMFRARLFHPETAAPGEAERVLDRIFKTYLSAGPDGGWMDAYDGDGRPSAETIPASMLYHILTAFSPLCWR